MYECRISLLEVIAPAHTSIDLFISIWRVFIMFVPLKLINSDHTPLSMWIIPLDSLQDAILNIPKIYPHTFEWKFLYNLAGRIANQHRRQLKIFCWLVKYQITPFSRHRRPDCSTQWRFDTVEKTTETLRTDARETAVDEAGSRCTRRLTSLPTWSKTRIAVDRTRVPSKTKSYTTRSCLHL